MGFMAAPLCFVSEDSYDNYLDSVAESNTQADYCYDCTALFQWRMKQLGKCLHPETTFSEENEQDHPYLNRVAPAESFVIGKRE